MRAQVVCLTYLFLSFIFAVIYYSSFYVFNSPSFDTSVLGSGFLVCTLRMRFM